MTYHDLRYGDSLQPPDYPKCYVSYTFSNLEHDLEGNVLIKPTADPCIRELLFDVIPSDRNQASVTSGYIDVEDRLLFPIWRDGVLIWNPSPTYTVD